MTIIYTTFAAMKSCVSIIDECFGRCIRISNHKHQLILKFNNMVKFRLSMIQREISIRLYNCDIYLLSINLDENIHDPATDSPREIWWTVSRNYTVLFLSRDVKNTKFNQYLPVLWASLNGWDSRFRKFVMFWMWRDHDMALWRHGGGTWHNGLILTTASNGNSWADVANHVTRLWQAGETEYFERRITG